MYHTTTWLLWLGAAILPAMLTRNPLYLIVLFLAAAIDYDTLGRTSPLAASWRFFLKVGLIVAAFSALFNPLTVHYGDTVLVTLPRLPLRVGGAIVLDLGGKITLEALSYGLTGGLSLMVVLLIFATFNALVDHYQLLRSIPAFMYQTGVVASIAIAFVPQMVASLKEIREAQAIRGHRFRGVRDLLPLLMPLLTSGLERAIQLAESMEARGFGGNVSRASPTRELMYKALIALALLGLLAGVFCHVYFKGEGAWHFGSARHLLRWTGAFLIAGSLLLLAGTFRAIGRRVRRSRYRRQLWRRRDTIVSAVSLASLVIIATFWLWDRKALIFYPYPRFGWPVFNPLIGLALLAAVVPVLCAPARQRSSSPRPGSG